MKIIPQSWSWEQKPPANTIQLIESAARTCYKSEDKTTPESAEDFVRRIMKRSHLSVIEHCYASVRIITDRGLTHQLVRHRIASFSESSTRYCNFAKDKFGSEITVIEPAFWYKESDKFKGMAWIDAMEFAEKKYMELLSLSAKPEEARSVLPNSLKTEIVMTCNMREWRHCFNLRCSKAAHPQIRTLMLDMLKGFNEAVPVIFEDLAEKYLAGEK